MRRRTAPPLSPATFLARVESAIADPQPVDAGAASVDRRHRGRPSWRSGCCCMTSIVVGSATAPLAEPGRRRSVAVLLRTVEATSVVWEPPIAGVDAAAEGGHRGLVADHGGVIERHLTAVAVDAATVADRRGSVWLWWTNPCEKQQARSPRLTRMPPPRETPSPSIGRPARRRPGGASSRRAVAGGDLEHAVAGDQAVAVDDRQPADAANGDVVEQVEIALARARPAREC